MQNGYVLPVHAAFIYARWVIAIGALVTSFFSPLRNLPGGRKPYPPERCMLVTLRPEVKKSKKSKKSLEAANALESDMEPVALPKQKLRVPCPEEYVSHASYLTFAWFLP